MPCRSRVPARLIALVASTSAPPSPEGTITPSPGSWDGVHPKPGYRVDWAGASFRGEGLGQSSAYDPKSFTSERAGRAVRAGVAAVLSGLTGIVVWPS